MVRHHLNRLLGQQQVVSPLYCCLHNGQEVLVINEVLFLWALAPSSSAISRRLRPELRIKVSK